MSSRSQSWHLKQPCSTKKEKRKKKRRYTSLQIETEESFYLQGLEAHIPFLLLVFREIAYLGSATWIIFNPVFMNIELHSLYCELFLVIYSTFFFGYIVMYSNFFIYIVMYSKYLSVSLSLTKFGYQNASRGMLREL